jgi:hypothetical protein
MLETALLPDAGAVVHLVRGSLCAEGTVVWNFAGRCGLEFSSEFSVREWIAPLSNTGQCHVDEALALVRTGQPAFARMDGAQHQSMRPTEPQLGEDIALVLLVLRDLETDLASSGDTHTRHSDELQQLGSGIQTLCREDLVRCSPHQVAEHLGTVFQLLVDIEDELTSSTDTLIRHGYKLQHLDLAMQMLGEIAGELTFGNGDQSPSATRLQNLRVACRRALEVGPGRPETANRIGAGEEPLIAHGKDPSACPDRREG